MNKNKLLACLLPLAISSSYASAETPQFHADADFYSDSDDLKVDQWSLGYQQSHGIFNYLHEEEPEKQLLWSVKAKRSTIDQLTKDDYRGQHLSAAVAYKYSKDLSTELSIGDGNLENRRTHKDNHLTTYSIKAQAKINPQLTVQAKQERDFLFDNAIVDDSSNNLLHGDTSDIGVYWRADEKWRVEGKANHLRLSDGNSSDKVSGSLLYGISPGWPWIWAGVSAEKLSFDKDRSSYWTPQDYQSVGLTLDSSFPVNDDLSMSFGANLNRSKEDNNPSGTGYSLSTGAEWKIAEQVKLKAQGYILESTQETSEWKQDGVSLSVNVKSF